MLGHTFCRYFWLSGTTLEVNSQGPSPHTHMPTIPCSFYLMDSSKGQVKKGCMWELESSEHCCPLEQEYQHGDQEREGTLSTSSGSIKGCCLLATALSADTDPRHSGLSAVSQKCFLQREKWPSLSDCCSQSWSHCSRYLACLSALSCISVFISNYFSYYFITFFDMYVYAHVLCMTHDRGHKTTYRSWCLFPSCVSRGSNSGYPTYQQVLFHWASPVCAF